MATSHRSSRTEPEGLAAYARVAFFAVLTLLFLIGGAALTVTPPEQEPRWGGGIFVGLFLLVLALMMGFVTFMMVRSLIPRRRRSSEPALGATAVIVMGLLLCVAGLLLGLAGPPIGWLLAVMGLVTMIWQWRERATDRGRG